MSQICNFLSAYVREGADEDSAVEVSDVDSRGEVELGEVSS